MPDIPKDPGSMIENIVKYLSLFTICAFILGYCSLSSYYGQFNISILNYISTTELIYELLPLTTILFAGGQLIILFIALGAIIAQYQRSSAEVKKHFGPGKNYSFVWKGKSTTTDSTLFVFGETQSYVFLWQKKDSSTRVYRRADIDSTL
ncbi:MAG TPA: hypothetical protein VHD83_03825 [Puia sp.]|nr:hypothetical protein [Puia sp.]